MSLRKFKIFIFILLVKTLFVNAQKEGFSRYTTKEGLLSDEVYNLHQDKLGYVWAFTNYGALKYNGTEFKPVLKNLSFNESFIYSCYENNQGQMWVANSNAKIYRVVNDSAFAIKGTEDVSENLRKTVSEIFQLYVDDSLNIYVITKRQCYKFVKKKDNTYSAISLSAQMDYDEYNFAVLQRGEDYLPISNSKGKETNHLSGKDFHFGIHLQDGKQVRYLEILKRGHYGAPRYFRKYGREIYFSFYNRIGIIGADRKAVRFVTFNNIILNFKKDRHGHTWLACLNDGVYELDEHDSIVHHYLENITINDILIDSHNGLWASSTGQGLFRYNNLNTQYFKGTEPLSQTISFMKKLDKQLFIGTAKGDVFVVKMGAIHHLLIAKDKKEDVIYNTKPLDVVKYGDDYYLSSILGFQKIRISEKPDAKTLLSIPIPNVYKLLIVSKDSFLYIQRRGLGFIVKNELKKRIDVDFKTYDFIRRGTTYFIGTEKGIRTHNSVFPADPKKNGRDIPIVKDSLGQPDFLAPSKNALIKRVVKGPANILWFCSTGSGIFLLDSTDKLTQLSIQNGLPSNVVNNISFPDNKDIFLCTNKGLFLSKSDIKDPENLKWIRIYNGEVENAVLFEDKVYLSTSGGLVIMDYDRLDQTENLNFNLASVFVNSAEKNLTALSELDHRHNTLEFKFDVIHFTPNKTGIVYSLKGPLKDSGSVEETTLKFQNLPPGEYRLTAYPNTIKGPGFAIVVPFIIKPAFWQTLTFIFCAILFLVVALVLALFLVFRNIKRKRDKKEEAQRLIMEYKLIALKAQINPHFMSNCLSAIQLLIINNKVDAATRYIAKFGLLVRQILNFSTRSVISISEELEIAILNMDLEQLRFENKFEYEIHLEPSISPKKIFVPALILNPIIENAIWHGLLPLKNKRNGKLIINIRQSAHMLLLIIEDNGVGRKQKRHNLSNSHQSKGLQITEQRLSNINYLYTIETAEIIYEDLFDKDANPSGTRVTISLPLNLTPLNYE